VLQHCAAKKSLHVASLGLKRSSACRHPYAQAVTTSSFDDLAESVLAQQIVSVAMHDLLLMAGSKRATQSVLARIDDELLQRLLETYPRLTTHAETMHVFRRDAAVAVLFDAVLNPSAGGDRRLAQATPKPADGIVHDLADLLALVRHPTLEGLCESVNDNADGNVWVHLFNEDEGSREDDHGRATGVTLHNPEFDSISLRYPFHVSLISDVSAELEATHAFRYRLSDLYEDTNVDWSSLVNYYLHLGNSTRVRGWSSEVWGNAPLELVSREDPTEVPIARFLKNGDIQFRLGADDVEGLPWEVRVSARGKGKRERVVCSPEDLELVEDLVLRASARRNVERGE